jgi:putative hydrolase of the HAD superfamily
MPISAHERATPRAVLFDLYGTLVSPGAAAARTGVVRAMAAELGADPDAYVAAVRDSFDERARGKLGGLEETLLVLAGRVGATPKPGAVARAAVLRLSFTRRLLNAQCETLSVLGSLRQADLLTALVSDCTIETPTLWPNSSLARLMQATAFSCLLGVRKPDPAIYLHAVAQLGVAQEECLFVGDGGSRELTGARALGMQAVRLLRPGEEEADRYDHDVAFTGEAIATLSDLLVLLGLAEEPALAQPAEDAGGTLR